MTENLTYTEENKSKIFGNIENFLHNLLSKEENETKANLSTLEWIIYIGSLIYVLVMPFLYSRLTTENFLTPKEFFSRSVIGLLGGLFCIGIFYKGLIGKKVAFSKTSLDFPLVAFFGFCILSVLWNYNAPSAIRDLRCVLIILLLYPIITNVYRSRWQIEILLWIVVFTGLATATIGFMETYNLYFQFNSSGISFVREAVLAKKYDPNGYYLPLFPQLASPNYDMGSVVSTFGNRNYLGTFAMFIAFIPLAFFFYYRNVVMKIISLGLFGWLLYGLYITRCRAALIGLGIGFIFMLIMILINDKKFRLIKRYGLFLTIIVSAFLLAGLIISAITIRSDTMWGKLKLTFTLNRLISNTYERMWVWYGNNKAFTESVKTILVGQGFGSFKHFFPLKEGEIFSDKNKQSFTAVTFRQAHNDWLQIFSELGIIGMILFLFLVKRYFASIQNALKRDIFDNEENSMRGDHVLIIALGASIVAQLFAGLPDFPFHRIETAVFAVIFISLVPVLTETNFFKSPLKRIPLKELQPQLCSVLMLITIFGTISNLYFEKRCWDADTRVREAEMLMNYRSNDLASMLLARKHLLKAINLDPLPGDPYNKLATWYEQTANPEHINTIINFINNYQNPQIDKNQLVRIGLVENEYSHNLFLQDLKKLVEELKNAPDVALKYANKAWNNINYNARSTYHSVIFRRMHIYYHALHDPILAYNEALKGLELTASEARSTYYFYLGRITMDLLRNPSLLKGSDIKEDKLRVDAEKYLKNLLKYDQYKLQGYASLALFYTHQARWKEALEYSEITRNLYPSDPSMHEITGISAYNLGDNKTALEALNKALELSPYNPIYHRDIGMVYMSLRNYAEAKKHFEISVSNSACPPDVKNQALQELQRIKTIYENINQE